MEATGTWSERTGPLGAVVVSSRVRLARNFRGFPFVRRASEAQRREILNLAQVTLNSPGVTEGLEWVDLSRAPERRLRLLVERHLISAQHAEAKIHRAAAISRDESLSIMVNEEDHLRMQALGAGLSLSSIYEQLNALDDRIDAHADFAFSERWGYLTACPTNVGTGVRFSVMLHLPALKITSEISRVQRAAKDLHLAVRGYYGEGSESAGDFYQISNQVTLGRSEREILEEFEGKVIPQLIDYELAARQILLERNALELDDRIHRSIGVLSTARLMGIEEAMKLLSRVRLGVAMARVPGLSLPEVASLFLRVQPAHLQSGRAQALNPTELRVARADLVREALRGTGGEKRA